MNIPQINAAHALARFDNDEETYLVLLEAFASHGKKYVQNVREFIAGYNAGSPDLNLFRIAAHSLKGTNRSIGAEELGAMAEKLEAAARGGDLDYIAANAASFAEAEENLIAALGAFLETAPRKAAPAKPEKEDPDPALLEAIKQAAQNYDMAALRKTIDALDEYSYRSFPDLAQWLREKAGKSDFQAIARRF